MSKRPAYVHVEEIWHWYCPECGFGGAVESEGQADELAAIHNREDHNYVEDDD